eukprot:10157006-Lingulodinium_polyedra.AAC.1
MPASGIRPARGGTRRSQAWHRRALLGHGVSRPQRRASQCLRAALRCGKVLRTAPGVPNPCPQVCATLRSHLAARARPACRNTG